MLSVRRGKQNSAAERRKRSENQNVPCDILRLHMRTSAITNTHTHAHIYTPKTQPPTTHTHTHTNTHSHRDHCRGKICSFSAISQEDLHPGSGWERCVQYGAGEMAIHHNQPLAPF